MAKRSRNKQAARERIARMRAEQARRRRRRIRLVSSAAAAAVIAVVAGITLAVTSGGSGATSLAPSGLSLAPLSTLGVLQPAPTPDRRPGRAGAANPERPVHRCRRLFLLAAHPCFRRHHPHRVPGPADLYPRRILR